MPATISSQLVLTVDFGTTYTGVTFSVLDESSDVESSNIKRIYWEDRAGEIQYKVPSVVCYDAVTKDLVSYGYDAKADSQVNHQKMTNFKLKLFLPEEESISINYRTPSPATPKLATAHFLTEVYKHVRSQMSDGSELEIRNSKVLFTVPAIFTTNITDQFRDLLEDTPWGTHEISLNVLEPEGAATYTAEEPNLSSKCDVGSSFIVCDAGGGTIDVASFEIRKTRPTLEMEKIGRPDAKANGSTRIDKRFLTYFYESFEKELLETRPQELEEIMDSFVWIKERFQDDPTRDLQLTVDLKYKQFANRPDVVEGMLRITRGKMRDLFEPSILAMKSLIQDHLNACKKENKRVNYIFLVGGLGSSAYVLKRMQNSARSFGIDPGRIIQSENCAFATILGASRKHVISQLTQEEDPVLWLPSPANYGVIFDLPRSWDKSLPEIYDRSTKKTVEEGQIVWLIRKGEELENTSNEVLSWQFKRTFEKKPKNVWRDVIVMSTLDNPPERAGDPGLKDVGTMKSDFRLELDQLFEVKKAEECHRPFSWSKSLHVCNCNVVIKINREEIQFQTAYKGGLISGPTRARLE